MAFLLHNLLQESAKHFAKRPAIIAPKESLTYQELENQSNTLALRLIAEGVEPGDLVGLLMHKSLHSIVAVYGILKTGAAYVPIDAFAPAQRSVAILKNTKLRVLISTADRVPTLIQELSTHPEGKSLQTILIPTQPKAVDIDRLQVINWNDDSSIASTLRLPQVTDTHLAYLLHTSGSTGVPKGVAISHRNALTFVDMATKYWQVNEEDRLCNQAPLHFDLSVFDLFVAARAGAAVVLIPEFYAAFPKKMASAIETHKITIWNSVVSTLTLMMEKGSPDKHCLDSIRAAIFSGEVMPIRHLRRLQEHLPNAFFYNVYGQTEANSSLVYFIDNQKPYKDNWKIPLGKPFPNFDVYLLDTNGRRITEANIRGEIYVRSGSVSMGYWNNTTLCNEKFVIDPLSPNSGARVYRTGDMATLDECGNLCFGGRSDDMIKSRGYRVELADIDLALLSCEGIAIAVTIAIPDEEIGNRLYAFVSYTEGMKIPTKEIIKYCRARLPKYMIPEKIFIRDTFPRTSTNKIDKKQLRVEASAKL